MKETKEKLELNKLEAKDGKLTVKHVHQTLETPKIDYETSVKLDGTIQAPGNFIEKRAKHDEQCPKDRCHVLFSYRGLYIKLRTIENWPVHAFVEGKLVVNPEIAELKISHKSVDNKHKFNGTKDLTQHLRFAKYYFADKEQNMRIVTNLQRFKIEAQKVIETADDNRGNAKDLYEISNNSNIDLSFDLMMPIYIGQPAKKFRVEIAYAVREKNVEVWLESPELADLLREDAITIIDAQLKRFPEEFVFIEQ